MQSESHGRVLDEVGKEFGSVSPFWKALSTSGWVLQEYWRSYELFLASGLIPRRTKLMIAYECALADGCPRCAGGFTRLLKTVGIDEATIGKLERDIKSSRLDDETKEVLVFAYRAAKDPHSIDARAVGAFTHLLGQEKVIEAVAWMNECKMLIDSAHSLNMHPLE